MVLKLKTAWRDGTTHLVMALALTDVRSGPSKRPRTNVGLWVDKSAFDPGST